jgi:ferredoxin
MSTWIVPDLCINCGVCESECPNNAITDGSDVGSDTFYIHPDLCTECVGFYDHEACQAVCPVECCLPDPKYLESEEVLAQRALTLHPDNQVLKDAIASGNFPSLKRKLPMVP